MSTVPEAEPEPRRLRFSLRSILIFTFFVAVVLGWMVDHWQGALRLAVLERKRDIERAQWQARAMPSGFRPSNVTRVDAEPRPDRDALERELARVLVELKAANARIEEFEIRQQFLSTARAEAAELFQDLPAIQSYLEWSAAQEEQFLRLPSDDQQKVVERARVLAGDGSLEDGVASTWRKDPLLARGVEKRFARQARTNAKRR